MWFLRNYWGLLFVLFLSLFSILPFLTSGFFPIHDNVQVTRVFEMSKSLSFGMFPVRWVPDLGYGYGYPIFNFYSVLPYYVGGVLVLIGLSALFATKLVFVFAIILSGVSMYFFTKEFFGKLPALVSAIIYLYFPYHAVNIYVRGDLAESTAYVFLPLVFLFLFKLHFLYRKKVVRGRKAILYVLGLASSLALVVISHNLSFFILILFVMLFIALSILASSAKKYLAFVYASSLFLAFLLSAFYSLPAVLEIGYSNVFSQVGGGANYRDHFVCLSQLWDSAWGFGGSAKGCVDGLSFKIGKVNVIIVFLSFILYLFSYKKFQDKRFLINTVYGFLLLGIFLILPISLLVWDSIPFMGFLQYPWRFLNMIGLFSSIAIGFFVYFPTTLGKKNLKYFVYIFASLIIIITFYTNLKLFNGQTYLTVNSDFYTNTKDIRGAFSKISDEYLPANFKDKTPLKESEIITGELGEVRVSSFDNKNPGRLRITIDAKTNSSFFVNRAFFPFWVTYVNGEKTKTLEKNGKVYFSLPKGEYSIDLILSETKIEKAANILSLIGIVTVIVVIISKRLDKFYAKKTS